MYLFHHNKTHETNLGTLNKQYLCAHDLRELKRAIIRKYKEDMCHDELVREFGYDKLIFEKRYGCVREEYGDVIGWICKIKEVK